MTKTLISLAITALLTACAITHDSRVAQPEVTQSMLQREFDTIPGPAAGKPVSVAVYSFQDKTGQRRPQANIASLSTAITQGAEAFLIKALQDVGRGQWFDVVERVGIDNLTKERLIIRQMREAYEGSNAKPLMPMQFAGMIVEGGIIGYDTSTKSGGVGARWLGIGASSQYSEDIVTVSLRAVSVNTGKVLMSVTVQKTILSSADSITALKFFDAGTQAFEGEIGMTINEPGTYAVKAAIEMAVLELIKEGQRKGIWEYKVTKAEEKTNELVQSQTPKAPPTTITQPTATPQQSNSGSSNGRSEENGTNQGKKEETESKPVTESVSISKPLEETVAAENPKDLAKNTSNPTLGTRADATVIASAPSVAAIPAPPEAPMPECKDMKEVMGGKCIVGKNTKRFEAEAENPKPNTESPTLFGRRQLKEDAQVYTEQSTTSVRKWWFKKGTVVSIKLIGNDGWVKVYDDENRGGWIQAKDLQEGLK